MANIRRVQAARFMAGQRVDHLMVPPTLRLDSTQPAGSTSKLENPLENLASEFSQLSMRLMEGQRARPKRWQDRPLTRKTEENPSPPANDRGGFLQRGRGSRRGQPMGRTADGRVIYPLYKHLQNTTILYLSLQNENKY